jgi:hypothetical protein
MMYDALMLLGILGFGATCVWFVQRDLKKKNML